MIYRTHCALRLGDNLCHLHFMRKLAQRYPADHFVHFAHRQYLTQIVDMVSDLENLKLRDLESVSDGSGDYWTMKPDSSLGSIDAWKNAHGFWEHHGDKNDWVRFSLHHFEVMAVQMGLKTPLVTPNDLLFDYPALRANPARQTPFDILVVNSVPMSGQLPGFSHGEMESLVINLAARHHVVTTSHVTENIPCTASTGLTVTQIGNLSRFCKYIVMVSTGPSWPTFSVFNKDTVEYRLILLGTERINLTPNTEHVASVAEARNALVKRGLL